MSDKEKKRTPSRAVTFGITAAIISIFLFTRFLIYPGGIISFLGDSYKRHIVRDSNFRAAYDASRQLAVILAGGLCEEKSLGGASLKRELEAYQSRNSVSIEALDVAIRSMDAEARDLVDRLGGKELRFHFFGSEAPSDGSCLVLSEKLNLGWYDY